ncbi:hypothetical protein [Halorussus salinus]|uniref:hypothetical protein n=1 Tax=Halorussus salinus TaxID=1364935 RepID=UPI00109203D3|nr:hypothetical protein [Halorussus salinus]
MRHEHLVVTVEADTKARIDDHLDGGESLEAWVADAIERKLADEEDADDAAARFGDAAASADESDADRGKRDPHAFDRGETDPSDSDPPDFVPRDDSGADPEDDDYDGGPDDYGEGFEYVDDCSI